MHFCLPSSSFSSKTSLQEKRTKWKFFIRNRIFKKQLKEDNELSVTLLWPAERGLRWPSTPRASPRSQRKRQMMLKSRGHHPIRHRSSAGSTLGVRTPGENPNRTQSQWQHQPAGTSPSGQRFLEGGEEAAPAQALPPALPSAASASPVLLQEPTSAQAEDASLSAVISPSIVLMFLTDCLAVSSSQTVNGEFPPQKIVSCNRERQTCPFISDLFNIPPCMTGTRKGVDGLRYLWPFKSWGC